MEGRQLGEEPGQQAEVIHRLQQEDEEFQQQAGDQVEGPSQLVEAGVRRGILHLPHLLVEALIDHLRGVGGRKGDFNDRVGRVRGHLLFDGHIDLDLPVPGEDLLARDEAVQARIPGAGADVSRQQHMEHTEIFHAGLPLLHDVSLHR